jgi:S-adenosylmethionine-diacylglycerol 3-amino-3-carboxypropyl transferase
MDETHSATPDAWAIEAAKLPLAFAQVREDPRLDVELAQTLPADATVVMIASGGETLVQLARLPLRRIHAVDMNPAQLALSRLKLHLAAHASADDATRILGHEDMPQRSEALLRLCDELAIPADSFGPPDFVALHGPDHAGRYERCFAELRRVKSNGADLDESLRQVMSLPNLTTLFGHEAAQNPRRPFDEHFAWRTRVALERADAQTNPFLRQMYSDTFAPGHRYDWLQTQGTPQAEVVYQKGRMREVLESLPPASADMVHLSNILDWLSPEQAAQTLAAASHALKPGGRVILRQLNSSLDMDALAGDIVWDHPLGQAMEQRDRSFFYPQILIGRRP